MLFSGICIVVQTPLKQTLRRVFVDKGLIRDEFPEETSRRVGESRTGKERKLRKGTMSGTVLGWQFGTDPSGELWGVTCTSAFVST